MAEYISFQPNDFFSTKLYTGNGTAIGSGGNAITGVGFQPDFTWMKQRNSTNNHNLQNSAVGATKYVNSDRNIAQVTNAESLTTWGADGFTLGNLADVNGSGNTFVSWNWKAGTTTGIDTTGSTITPSAYSFNATSGFSIIAYTGNATSGATLPHGLGVAPKMIMVKALDATENWRVYHADVDASPQDKYMILDTTAAVADATWAWNDTAPTSTLFSLGSGGSVNGSGNTFIAYCFADVKGFSKFGSYTGNGNTDGPFVYTGFRPAFILMKRTDSTGNWTIWDSKREGYNSTNDEIYANTTAAEGTGNVYVDLVSNGFKWLVTDGMVNADGGNYIYAAFAEFPIVSSNDVPTVAR